MQIGIFDGKSGKQIVRDATPEEIAAREAEIDSYIVMKKAQELAAQQEIAKKQAAQAKLAAIGLDLDDLRALGL